MSEDPAHDTAGPAADPQFGPWLAQASILVVDDEPGMRNFLVKILGPRSKLIAEAADTKQASQKLDQQHFDVVILDNIMPRQNGLDWLAEQRAVGFFADVILMTAYADLDTAIGALRAGAVDFVLKPFRSNQLLNAVARCLDRIRLQRENDVLHHELKSPGHQIFLSNKLLGDSRAIRNVRQSIARVAPLPTLVLLTGRSGTGKEVAARSLHSLSGHSDKLFVPINCGAIPADMIESELFGHLKGAFTGAGRARECQAGRLGTRGSLRRPLHLCHQCRSSQARRGRQFSCRSLLPYQCRADPFAAAEGSRRRCAGTCGPVHARIRPAARHAPCHHRRQGTRCARTL